MTPKEKEELIDRYLEGASAFDDVLTMAPALLSFRPMADAWTIHEHAFHFVESDITGFHRYRKAVAEPGGPVIGFDEEKWTSVLGYHSMSLTDALSLLKLLRKLAASHLRTMVSADWNALSYQHNAEGRVDLEAWILHYIDHVRFHREYIERNKKLFATV